MTKRPDELYMADMLDMARQAHAKVNGITLDAFLADEDRKLAVTHLVILIGEAASQVSRETRERHADVPWREAAATRNRVVHGYYSVEYETIYAIARRNLPELVAKLETLL